MKRWAVGFMSAFENDLKLYVVEAQTWRGAILAALPEWSFDGEETTLEDEKEAAFNGDCYLNVIEIP